MIQYENHNHEWVRVSLKIRIDIFSVSATHVDESITDCDHDCSFFFFLFNIKKDFFFLILGIMCFPRIYGGTEREKKKGI